MRKEGVGPHSKYQSAGNHFPFIHDVPVGMLEFSGGHEPVLLLGVRKDRT